MKANRLLLSALVSSALMSAGAMAADGTINFSGSITASACETIVGAVQDGNSTPSLTATVNLLSATSDAFSAVGDIVNKTPFSIQLSGCAASTGAENVRALFSGTAPVAGEPNLLANTGGATNVGIVILNSA
ncbi:type 1 fimbrial protein [Citrobacter amalonaticus]|nr:fimbrial protein [Citrobacter amalonaticus]MCR9027924.1 type 1 fimbrial protein [Citrobacter amalonaticus]